MTDEIKKLIKEYGSEIFPYLVLRAEHKEGDFLQLADINIDQEILKELEVSGFIGIKDSRIQLFEDSRPIYLPKKSKVKVKKLRGDYRPQKLEILGSIMGYPVDWHLAGKYRKLFSTSINKHGYEKLLKLAHWISKNIEGVDIRVLFSDKMVAVYSNQMSRKKPEFEDRVAKENYEDEDCEF